MGVKRVPKRRLPKERGLTERSIGAAKGKRKCLYTDPYAGGERSGTRAKPDALSAAANARARTAAHPVPHAPNALPAPSVLSPASAPDACTLGPSLLPHWGFPFAPGPLAPRELALPPMFTFQ
jgi:hypothetical protein